MSEESHIKVWISGITTPLNPGKVGMAALIVADKQAFCLQAASQYGSVNSATFGALIMAIKYLKNAREVKVSIYCENAYPLGIFNHGWKSQHGDDYAWEMKKEILQFRDINLIHLKEGESSHELTAAKQLAIESINLSDKEVKQRKTSSNLAFTAAQRYKSPQLSMKPNDEMSIGEVATKLNASRGEVERWVERGMINILAMRLHKKGNKTHMGRSIGKYAISRISAKDIKQWRDEWQAEKKVRRAKDKRDKANGTKKTA